MADLSRSSEGGGGGRRSLWTCKKIIEGCLSRLLPALYLGPSVRPPSSLSSYPSFQFPRQPARSSGSDSFPEKKKEGKHSRCGLPWFQGLRLLGSPSRRVGLYKARTGRRRKKIRKKKKVVGSGDITKRALGVARQWCLATFSRLATSKVRSLKVRSRHPVEPITNQ